MSPANGTTAASPQGSPNVTGGGAAKRRRKIIRSAVIAGGAVIAAVIGVVVTDWYTRWQDSRNAFHYQMDAPVSGAEVLATAGFQARGTVENLPPGEALWILDRDLYGFTVDEQAKIDHGTWSASSTHLAGKNAKFPFNLEFVVIRATPSCSDALDTAEDGYVRELPDGCKLLEKRMVRVTGP